MTRRTLAILFLAVFAIPTVHAQVGDPRNTLSVGVSGGMGTSRVSFVPSIRQTLSLGPTYGVSVRHISEKYFFLICGTQLECNMASRGWTELIEDGSGNEYTRIANYVEVPFLAHIGFGREYRGVQGHINLGPQVSYLLSEREIYGGQKPWDVSNRPNNVTEQYGKAIENKLDYGITASVGLELHTGIGNFGLEGRYYFGLGNIYGITKRDYFARCANSTISVRATYSVTLF
ncbi:MAG: PorT family protein [Bacteroidaceae bacterium]|nr:PorT family protein [Bacteroidaceae bacterium]